MLQGLAFGFVLLRVESLAEEGKVRVPALASLGRGCTLGSSCFASRCQQHGKCRSGMHAMYRPQCTAALLTQPSTAHFLADLSGCLPSPTSNFLVQLQ